MSTTIGEEFLDDPHSPRAKALEPADKGTDPKTYGDVLTDIWGARDAVGSGHFEEVPKTFDDIQSQLGDGFVIGQDQSDLTKLRDVTEKEFQQIVTPVSKDSNSQKYQEALSRLERARIHLIRGEHEEAEQLAEGVDFLDLAGVLDPVDLANLRGYAMQIDNAAEIGDRKQDEEELLQSWMIGLQYNQAWLDAQKSQKGGEEDKERDRIEEDLPIEPGLFMKMMAPEVTVVKKVSTALLHKQSKSKVTVKDIQALRESAVKVAAASTPARVDSWKESVSKVKVKSKIGKMVSAKVKDKKKIQAMKTEAAAALKKAPQNQALQKKIRALQKAEDGVEAVEQSQIAQRIVNMSALMQAIRTAGKQRAERQDQKGVTGGGNVKPSELGNLRHDAIMSDKKRREKSQGYIKGN